MKNFLISRKIHAILLILLLGFFTWFSGSGNDLRLRFQYLVFDGYNKLHPRQKPEPHDPQVIIVDIDENSLRKIGQWPWPRDIVAQLIENLNESGVKAIAFDMVFAEEDRTSPHRLIHEIPALKDHLPEGSLMDHDLILSRSMKQAGNVVTGFTSAGADETRRIPHQPVPPTLLVKEKDKILESVFQAKGLATNLPLFPQSAAGNAHFMAVPERDGIIRKVSLFTRFNPPQFENRAQTLYPILSLEALRVAVNPKARLLIRQKKDRSLFDPEYEVRIGNYSIPMSANGQMWVHYRPMGKAEYIPAHFMLGNIIPDDHKQRLKDSIVFIGTSAEGLRDIRSTPIQSYIAGVEVHANALEQMMQGTFLKRPDFMAGAEAIAVFSGGLVLILTAFFTNFFWMGAALLIMIGGFFTGSWIGFYHYGLLLDPVYPAVALFLLFFAAALLNYLRVEYDRRRVKNAFGHYIAPAFMEELTRNPERLKLGGETRDLTVMFTDIRNFTTISESFSPEELTELMNRFLTPMSDLVMESRGTIDKYMGDAMMAFWNAPLDDPDHAVHACQAALKMDGALRPINEALKAQGKTITLEAGIGLNSGLCSVGNMGSQQRFAYSALGDTVNLASRLEGQTKFYGVNILIGEDTHKKLTGIFSLELDLIQVKGKEKPVRIFTIFDEEKLSTVQDSQSWLTAHQSMLAAYRSGDFLCAAQDCKEAMSHSNNIMNRYYAMFSDRIAQMIKTPPGKGWEGVFIATSK